MERPPAELLADRSNHPYCTRILAADNSTAVEAAGERWVVAVTSDGTIAGALPPGSLVQEQRTTLADLLHATPPTVIAAADTPVSAALASPAFDALESGSAVVLTDARAVVGVWAGEDLRNALATSAWRTGSDSQLPGPVQIPVVVRVCGHREGIVACPAHGMFEEYPDDLPTCENPAGLQRHRFVW
ncbi:hypothetical protein ACFTTN_31685 [Streptomyces niveus]|uniref:hypothetical protein n=1 Tax=Streptomyces niveus TaxID=193462 RepID=UPI00362EBBA7